MIMNSRSSVPQSDKMTSIGKRLVSMVSNHCLLAPSGFTGSNEYLSSRSFCPSVQSNLNF